MALQRQQTQARHPASRCRSPRRVVAQTKGLHIPAIAITAYQDRREELLAEGFVELIEKPLDPLALCEVVRRHAQLQT